MNAKHLAVLCSLVLLLTATSTHAQVFRITAFGQEGFVMGDFAKKEINNLSAGYADFGSTNGLEFTYFFKSKVGLSLRWSGTYFGRDIETFETDVKGKLGISGDLYDLRQSYGYWAFGSDLGISYQIDLSKKLQLEPYFYFGAEGMLSPVVSAIYTQNNTTFQYGSQSQLFFGISYSPGLKLHWNPWKHFGFYFSLEYDGKSFFEDVERGVISSYNSLAIEDQTKNYQPQQFNVGIGLAFRFGKGLTQ